MRILIIHNEYGKFSGEEAAVFAQKVVLEHYGHDVFLYTRKSSEIDSLRFGKFQSFFTAFYNHRSIKDIKKKLIEEKPDIVHVHNLYPLISPCILPVIKKMGIPIVMTVHNYRLICPNGLFFTHGQICERCAHGREWNCILQNCEGSFFKSTGYALRNIFARIKGYYLKNVYIFVCLTSFQKKKLIENEFPDEKIVVIPNFNLATPVEKKARNFILFVGRLNRQKGFDLLVNAMKLIPDVELKAAGHADEGFINRLEMSKNIQILGQCSKVKMDELYSQASFLVFTSVSYEGFPMVFLEAMNHKLPIIAPEMAGYPEIIENNVNGLLYVPGDEKDLAYKMQQLYYDANLQEEFGENGRNKLKERFSAQMYHTKLMDVYRNLI